MLRFLIGSSNVYRHYNHDDYSEYPKFKMVKCTNKEVFAVALEGIGEGKGQVIVSVIENLLCDAVRDITDPEELNNALESTIKNYLASIKEVASRRPRIQFALAQPTLRPLHNWFTEGHDAFCTKIGEGIRIMNCLNVSKIEAPIRMSQVFEADGVHLTPSSGKVFINALLYNADSLFSAEVIDLERDNIDPGCESDAGTEDKTGKNSKHLSSVKLEIANLRNEIDRRRVDDCMVTARIREELDFLSNVKKEDRVILTGLTSKVPMPTGFEEKKKWLRELVGGVLDQIEEGSSSHVLNVMQGWKGSNNIPLAEVRIDNVELAAKLRKMFATKKKAGTDFGRIYVANSVTLGTRVRIEILKAIAKNCVGEKETMYVSAFSSRPLLHIKPKGEGPRPVAYTFADAVTKFGEQLRRDDLGDAYRRAGMAFRGQLQQNFVVLHDTHHFDSPTSHARGAASSSGTRGRGSSTARPFLKRRLGNGDKNLETPEKKKK